MKTTTLKKRSEFLDIQRNGTRLTTKSLVLEYKKSETPIDSFEGYKIGYTASKKVGNSVYRNIAKRRLRAVSMDIAKKNPKLFKRDYSYNLIARYNIIKRDYNGVMKDLKYALHNVE